MTSNPPPDGEAPADPTKKIEELPTAIVFLDHRRGWFFHDRRHVKAWSVGPFETEAKAVAQAVEWGYAVDD